MGYIERQFKDYLVFNMLNGGAGATITYDNITSPNFPFYTIVGGANRFDPSIYSFSTKFTSSTEYDLDRE